MPATRTALAKDVSQENREDHPVVQHLQRQVANAFVLYANYKHYHWQTFGPFFRDLHLMFDEFAKDVLDTADEFAERVRMIGQDVQKRSIAADAGSGQCPIGVCQPVHA